MTLWLLLLLSSVMTVIFLADALEDDEFYRLFNDPKIKRVYKRSRNQSLLVVLGSLGVVGYSIYLLVI